MKEKDLKIDLSCHVIYSKNCKKLILEKIRQHYGEADTEDVFEKVQHQYEYYLENFSRRDLGGSKNFHNGTGGTYDCIMIVSYYVVCREKTSFAEIEEMVKELTVPSFGHLGFVNLNRPLFKHLMYKAFRNAEKKCERWHDFEMHLDPYSKDRPLHYCFTRCPFADFIHQYHLEEIAGALCNVDYASMEVMNVKLVRKHTCIESDHCDYTFFSNDDPALAEHKQYVDEKGFIRNE